MTSPSVRVLFLPISHIFTEIFGAVFSWSANDFDAGEDNNDKEKTE
jgi:hypothetical protein